MCVLSMKESSVNFEAKQNHSTKMKRVIRQHFRMVYKLMVYSCERYPSGSEKSIRNISLGLGNEIKVDIEILYYTTLLKYITGFFF